MDKGPFSVEWLAQSSRSSAREAPATGAPPSPGRPGAPRPREPPRSSSSPERGAEAGAGRPRTKFSSAQLQELERSFREQRYIGTSEKRRLAAALGLSQSQIKTWFQNRRMKFKRQTQDARVEALFSGLLVPYSCYAETVTSQYPHGAEVGVSSPSAVIQHPAGPSPALLLPPLPSQPLEPLLQSPSLVLPPSADFSSYPPAIPAMTLSKDHKRLRFQSYLPSC